MLKKIAFKLSNILPDRIFASIYFIYKHRYIPRFSEPRSLNEKINYIKLSNRNPLRETIVDRLKVREYVKSKSPDCLLPQILWQGGSLDSETWANLPRQFALKANHGSKMTKIVDKEVDSYDDILNLSKAWLAKDYSSIGREWVYAGLEKYLIAEALLDDNGSIPPDYKFFCSSGKVHFIQVDLTRFSGHRRNFYTADFQRIDAEIQFRKGPDIPKPRGLDAAISVAEDLSVDFDFIRVDLYLVDGVVYFGELTNTPGNGFERVSPKSSDFNFGRFFPEKIIR